jgi:hypothetical protein
MKSQKLEVEGECRSTQEINGKENLEEGNERKRLVSN